MRVTWLVSPNGLGHAVRSCKIAAALERMLPGVAITLCMETWQREQVAINDLRATVVSGLLADGPRWPHRPGHDLLAWRDRVGQSGALDGADLVISDNLAGVLALRPDAVLLGSFLWSDVLQPLGAAHPEVARFCDDERALLAAHRPPMICVQALAMPGVLAQTRAVQVPFMGHPGQPSLPAPVEQAAAAIGGVTLVGGASGAADQRLAALGHALDAIGVPRRTHLALARLVICRPGVGTITDCLSLGRPMLLIGGDDSLEMRHNATRLVALGVARRLPDEGGEQAAALATQALLADPAALDAMSQAARRQPQGGLAAAAQYLADRLESGPTEAKKAHA